MPRQPAAAARAAAAAAAAAAATANLWEDPTAPADLAVESLVQPGRRLSTAPGVLKVPPTAQLVELGAIELMRDEEGVPPPSKGAAGAAAVPTTAYAFSEAPADGACVSPDHPDPHGPLFRRRRRSGCTTKPTKKDLGLGEHGDAGQRRASAADLQNRPTEPQPEPQLPPTVTCTAAGGHVATVAPSDAMSLGCAQGSATPQRLRTYIVAIFTAELEESETQQPWFVPSPTDVASDLTQAWAAQARLRGSMGARFPTARQQQRCHREHVRSARAVKPVPPTSQRLKGCGSPPRLRFNFPFQSHEIASSLDSTLVIDTGTSSWRPRFNWPFNWPESEPDPPSGAACGDVPTAASDAEPAEPPSTRATPTPALCGTSPCTDASVWIELIGTTGGSSGARRLSVGTAQPQASADDAHTVQAAAATAAAGGSARPAWAVAGGPKLFGAGQLAEFVITCPDGIGEIKAVRVWHDADGADWSSSRWKLERVHVRVHKLDTLIPSWM
jgi:hypothetical protein